MRRRALLSVGLALAALTACAPSSASYRSPAGFEITSPGGDDEVRLPVRLTWTDPVGAAAYLVFVDRAPVSPGGTMTDLITSGCRRTPGCPDAAWYSQQGIIVATGPSATIAAWPTARARRVHHVTVVRMDSSGRRAGEASAAVELLSPKATS